MRVSVCQCVCVCICGCGCICVCVWMCVDVDVCGCVWIWMWMWKRQRACMSYCRRMIHLCICDLPDNPNCFCNRLSSFRTSRSDIARRFYSPHHWSRRTAAGTSPLCKCTCSSSPSPRWQQTKQHKVKVKQERLICKRGLIDLKKNLPIFFASRHPRSAISTFGGTPRCWNSTT